MRHTDKQTDREFEYSASLKTLRSKRLEFTLVILTLSTDI